MQGHRNTAVFGYAFGNNELARMRAGHAPATAMNCIITLLITTP